MPEEPKKDFLGQLVGDDGVNMNIGFEILDIIYAGIAMFVAITGALVVANAINKRTE